MKQFSWLGAAVILLLGGAAHAEGGALTSSGYQPWWNIFAKRSRCLTPEEERLQKFWHDYYDALRQHYATLDHIDWVAYYKNHGYQVGCGCSGTGCCGAGCGRINYAPVFVSPALQWAIPGGPPLNGPAGPLANGPAAPPPPAARPGR
jgi:hypothetical protein